MPPVEFFMSLPIKELIARYRKGVENYDRRVFWLNASDIDTAFLPDAGVGRWPIRVLLGHLADAEMLFVHRMRKVAAPSWRVSAYSAAKTACCSTTPSISSCPAAPKKR